MVMLREEKRERAGRDSGAAELEAVDSGAGLGTSMGNQRMVSGRVAVEELGFLQVDSMGSSLSPLQQARGEVTQVYIGTRNLACSFFFKQQDEKQRTGITEQENETTEKQYWLANFSQPSRGDLEMEV